MINDIASFLLAFALFAASFAATIHILLTKTDVRAAIGWVAILWLVPGIGAFGYLILGVNRIQRKAEQARQHKLGLSLAEQRRYGCEQGGAH